MTLELTSVALEVRFSELERGLTCEMCKAAHRNCLRGLVDAWSRVKVRWVLFLKLKIAYRRHIENRRFRKLATAIRFSLSTVFSIPEGGI